MGHWGWGAGHGGGGAGGEGHVGDGAGAELVLGVDGGGLGGHGRGGEMKGEEGMEQRFGGFFLDSCVRLLGECVVKDEEQLEVYVIYMSTIHMSKYEYKNTPL